MAAIIVMAVLYLKTTPDDHIVPPGIAFTRPETPSAPPLRFVHRVPESPYGTLFTFFENLISPGGLFKRHIVVTISSGFSNPFSINGNNSPTMRERGSVPF